MRGNSHVRFGGRAEETDRLKSPHRASARPNHTGNTLAAATGASTRELMARMGHASPRAALIYQHASADRDAAIARALSDLAAAQKPAVVLHLGDQP
jgi:integrase